MLGSMLQLQALRKDNVKVVLINPGPVATSMTKVCDCTSLHLSLHAPACLHLAQYYDICPQLLLCWVHLHVSGRPSF